MMVNAGRMRQKITIQRITYQEDELEQNKQGWEDFKTVHAEVRELRGSEYWEAKKLRPKSTYKIIIRYLKGISEEMRIKYGGRIFNIKDINDVYERHEYMELQCEEEKQTDEVNVIENL
jgi:SPP1 family predicted phage head-tail adaptor